MVLRDLHKDSVDTAQMVLSVVKEKVREGGNLRRLHLTIKCIQVLCKCASFLFHCAP